MITVALEGMQFFARHGVYASEQEKGNQFEVDIYLQTEAAQDGGEDQLENAVDYAAVYQVVKTIMENRKNLLESLLAAILREVLASFPEVISLRARVSKLNPPLEGVCQRSFVEGQAAKEAFPTQLEDSIRPTRLRPS